MPDDVIWSEALSREFVYLKTRLCSLPSITVPYPSDLFILQTDASGIGLGAVLGVHCEEEEILVAFFSQKQRHYSPTKLKGLAVVAAISTSAPTFLHIHLSLKLTTCLLYS